MKDICLSKNGLCLSRNGFDGTTWLTPSGKLFQALNMKLCELLMIKKGIVDSNTVTTSYVPNKVES